MTRNEFIRITNTFSNIVQQMYTILNSVDGILTSEQLKEYSKYIMAEDYNGLNAFIKSLNLEPDNTPDIRASVLSLNVNAFPELQVQTSTGTLIAYGCENADTDVVGLAFKPNDADTVLDLAVAEVEKQSPNQDIRITVWGDRGFVSGDEQCK